MHPGSVDPRRLHCHWLAPWFLPSTTDRLPSQMMPSCLDYCLSPNPSAPGSDKLIFTWVPSQQCQIKPSHSFSHKETPLQERRKPRGSERFKKRSYRQQALYPCLCIAFPVAGSTVLRLLYFTAAWLKTSFFRHTASVWEGTCLPHFYLCGVPATDGWHAIYMLPHTCTAWRSKEAALNEAKGDDWEMISDKLRKMRALDSHTILLMGVVARLGPCDWRAECLLRSLNTESMETPVFTKIFLEEVHLCKPQRASKTHTKTPPGERTGSKTQRFLERVPLH